MISSLRGTVLRSSGTACVIEVGGVGFALQITPEHARSLHVGEQALVLTVLVVRDDSLALFGFASEDHLSLFELLTGVPGVGPKSAMGVLSALDPPHIVRAVVDEDDAAFRKVPGVGPKTAKLIVVQLTGKVQEIAAGSPDDVVSTDAALHQRAVVALVGLGWSERVAEDALRALMLESPDVRDLEMPALLRLALARLGPGDSVART